MLSYLHQKLPKMTLPPLPIEILDPIDDVRYLPLSAPHHLACL
jgi:hypothetical protein